MSMKQLHYGLAPTRNGSVVYQPDVVIVDGGGEAVRSVTGDGLTWTIKGNAGHARELATGKILFVTGRGVGRVLGVRPEGADLAVTIGPVQLTDVIQKADITYDQPIDIGSMVFYGAPSLPGSPPDASSSPSSTTPGPPDSTATTDTTPPAADTTPPTSDTTPPTSDTTPPTSDTTPPPSDTTPTSAALGVQLPRLALIAATSASGQQSGTLPLPTRGSSGVVQVNGFYTTPIANGGGLGAEFNYSKANGVFVRGKALLSFSKPTLTFHLKMDGTKIIHADLSIGGGVSFTLSFEAGAGKDAVNANINKDIRLPVDISIPLGGPLPFAMTISQVLKVQTAFAAQGTLSATGNFGFGGALGLSYDGGQVTAIKPAFSNRESVAGTIDGHSLAPNALILSDQVRMIIGLGAFGFAVGPSATMVTRLGITIGADEAVIKCRSATFNAQLGTGLGYSIPASVVAAVNGVLGLLNLGSISGSGGVETFQTIFNPVTDNDPPTQGCKV
jgi:hypothetical protein